MKHFLSKGLFCLTLLTVFVNTGHAAIIHESATLGPTGNTLGNTVASTQFMGSRFTLNQTMVIDHIGGHLRQFENGSLFGAIVRLTSPTALPIGTPFDLGEVLAHTTFTTTFLSSDLLIPLSVTLNPGNYALIFGSGLFGATGIGSMALTNTDIPGSDSYFFWDGRTFQNSVPRWRNNSLNNLRFVVTGNPIPEPGTMLLVATGIVGLIAWRGKKLKE